MKTNAIEVTEVVKRFSSSEGIGGMIRNLVCGKGRAGAPAVDGVSFSVADGETFGLLGRNASGKSTIIRIIATLVRQDAGRVSILGHNVETNSLRVKGLIGRVSVDASFWKMLSPIENLHHYALLYGLPARETMKAAQAMLDGFSVTKRDLEKPVRTLSRGTQQKVAIVRALLHKPKVLLLDEPTTGLDPASKLSVHGFLKDLRQREGTTIVLTTHDMNEAQTLCDRLAFMTRGKIVEQDSVSALVKRNSNLEELFVSLTGENLEEWREPVKPAVASGAAEEVNYECST